AAPAAPLAPAAAVAADRVLALGELPPDVQRELSKLQVSGGVYSENPASRMLVVGGQVVTEGAEAAPGVVVEQIRAKSAVLKFRGYRFSVQYWASLRDQPAGRRAQQQRQHRDHRQQPPRPCRPGSQAGQATERRERRGIGHEAERLGLAPRMPRERPEQRI